MIFKVIHYCWFSNKEKPGLIKSPMNSWYEKLNDYNILEWDTNNFNHFITNYNRQPYKSRKCAFVANYFKLRVLLGRFKLNRAIFYLSCKRLYYI